MASLKQAIRAKCKDCTYDPLAGGTYLQQIEDCSVRACPLWEVRPMTVATINLNRKARAVEVEGEVDIDALIAGMDDEEDEPVAMAA